LESIFFCSGCQLFENKRGRRAGNHNPNELAWKLFYFRRTVGIWLESEGRLTEGLPHESSVWRVWAVDGNQPWRSWDWANFSGWSAKGGELSGKDRLHPVRSLFDHVDDRNALRMRGVGHQVVPAPAPGGLRRLGYPMPALQPQTQKKWRGRGEVGEKAKQKGL
jgi:hypothetical protein